MKTASTTPLLWRMSRAAPEQSPDRVTAQLTPRVDGLPSSRDVDQEEETGGVCEEVEETDVVVEDIADFGLHKECRQARCYDRDGGAKESREEQIDDGRDGNGRAARREHVGR